MIHYFVSEAEGVCGASVPGYVATQLKLVWVAVFGPAGLVDNVSWLSCFVFQYILQVLPVAPGRSVLAWGCGLVFGLISRFIPATGWPDSRLALGSVSLGCQDFSPPICEQVSIILELLPLLL